MSRYWSLLAAFIVGLWSVENIHDADVWWHLASGRWMWDHASLLRADPFTWTVPGRHWLNYEWLFQALFYAAYKLGQVPGLLLFKALLLAIGAAGFFKACEDELPPGLNLMAILAAFAAMRFRNFARAELASFCLFPWFIAGISKVMKDGSSWRRWALILVPLTAVWTNSHAGFWHALVIMTLAAASWRLRGERAANPFIILGLLCAIAGLFNPFGLELYTRTLHNAHLFLSMRSADFNEYAPTPLDAYPFFWSVLAGAWGLCFTKAWKEKRIDAFDWGVLAYASWLGPRFVRNIPFALMLAIPVAARSVRVFWRRSWDRLAVLACIPLALFGLRKTSWGVEDPRYPVKAAQFVLQNHPAGNGFNDFDFGSYLIWAFYGQSLPVFVDGRIDAIDGYRDVWTQVQRARAFSPEALRGWKELMSRWDPGWCLMQVPAYRLFFHGRPVSVFAYYFPAARWALVYHDRNAAVYARRDGTHAALISKYEIKGDHPDADPGRPADVPWERLFEETH